MRKTLIIFEVRRDKKNAFCYLITNFKAITGEGEDSTIGKGEVVVVVRLHYSIDLRLHHLL